MAGATIHVKDETPISVVKMPSRRSDQADRWRIELGTYDAGEVEYPVVSVYLSREEASELANKLLESIA